MLNVLSPQPSCLAGRDRVMPATNDLIAAAKNGYYGEVVALVASGVHNVDARDKDQATPLYWGASRGHQLICKALIDAGCDVNACVKWGSTALHAAADRGHADCLNLLIASGAAVDVQNQRGDTALHLAAYRGFRDIVLSLTQAGADPFTKNAQSKTPLQEAQSQQHVAAANLLLTYMEKFGLHTFKSLPESNLSKTQQQQQHRHHLQQDSMADAAAGRTEEELSSGQFSVPPAQSWPRFQSFHKLPSEHGSRTSIPDSLRRCEGTDQLWKVGQQPPTCYNDLSGHAQSAAHKLERDGVGGGPGLAASGMSVGRVGGGGGGGPEEASCRDRLEVQAQNRAGSIQTCGVRPGHQRMMQETPRVHPVSSENVESEDFHHPGGQHVAGGEGAARKSCDSHDVSEHRNIRTDPRRIDSTSMNALFKTLPSLNDPNNSHSVASHPTHFQQHLNLLSQEPGHDMRTHNGTTRFSQSSGDGTDSTMRPPCLAPPPRAGRTHSGGDAGVGFVSHEDLTQFAESLQMEIVNLRDAMAEQEKEATRLQDLVTQLRREADVQQRKVEALAAARESEVADLTRRLAEAEKLNLDLQTAFTHQITRLKQAIEERDSRFRTLTLKSGELETLNAKMQQVVVSQQESIRSLATVKDAEIGQLRDRLVTLQGSGVRSPATQPRRAPENGSHVPSSRRPELNGLAERGFSNEAPFLTHASNTQPPAAQPTSTSTADSSASPFGQPFTNGAVNTHPTFKTSSSASARPCDATSASPVAGACISAGGSPRADAAAKAALPSGSPSQQRAKVRVAELLRSRCSQGKLDADGREWTAGKEYSLLDPLPLNCAGGQRKGSNSLVFSVAHKGGKYVLKMLMNLLNLTHESHSLSGRSLDAHLLHRFGAEFHAPLLLQPPHPNVVPVRHHYQGDTTHFRGYLPYLVPEGLDVPVEMARRTTFLVLDHYPETLQSFFSAWQEGRAGLLPGELEGNVSGGGERGPPRGLDTKKAQAIPKRLPELFSLQLTYQLLSAVAYLQSHGVVHRDIKADNVFLDQRLRPVLGDFGFARTLRGHDGWPLALASNEQVYAGNPQAWAPELCRLSRAELDELPRPLTLEEVYGKSDAYAVARMLCQLLQQEEEEEDGTGDPPQQQYPTPIGQQPHDPDTALPCRAPSVLTHVLRSLLLDDPDQRPTTHQALLSLGAKLCTSSGADLSTLQGAEDFCSSRLQALSCLDNLGPDQSEHRTLNVTESVAANQDSCLADVLVRFSAKELWEANKQTLSWSP